MLDYYHGLFSTVYYHRKAFKVLELINTKFISISKSNCKITVIGICNAVKPFM